jgi:ABC-2 type transport system permease protein
VQVVLVLVSAVLLFDMPVRGNVFLLLLLTLPFLMFSLGLGLFISTVSRTQFQAMQSSLLILLPSVLLSGFIFPIESMPRLAQWISTLLPLTYYLRIVRGIIVKGVSFQYLWLDTTILILMGIITLVLASLRIKKALA